jgi:hypothetical protein
MSKRDGFFVETRADGFPWTKEGCNERRAGTWAPYATFALAQAAITERRTDRTKWDDPTWARAEYRIMSAGPGRKVSFEDWKAIAAKHAEQLVNIADMWDADDPYNLAEVAIEAYDVHQSPRAFVEEQFADDIARFAYDAKLAQEAIEASQCDEEEP